MLLHTTAHLLLIVDQEQQTQLQQILASSYVLTIVDDGTIPDNLTFDPPIDLIIISLALACRQEFALVKALRNHPVVANLPLLLLASPEAGEQCLEGIAAGATDYCLEPYIKAELQTRICKALKGNLSLPISTTANPLLLPLSTLLHRLPEAVIATDLDYRITYLNLKAENLYGVRANQVIGYALSNLYQCQWLQPEDEAIAIKSLATLGEWHGENRHLCRDGHILHVATSLTVLRDAQAEPIGLLTVLRDITQFKCTELALKESELHLSHLAENIREAFWIMDLIRQKVFYVSPAYEQIFKLSRRVLYRNAWDWLQLVHPDDRHLVSQSSSLANSNYNNSCLEYRIIRSDGSVRWIRDRRFPIRNTLGQPYRLIGLLEDWTEQKQASQQLKAALAEKEVLLRELHHRVKNNLQIISGLLYLQGYHLNNPDLISILKASRDRIESMAHIHDQLCRSHSLARIDLKEYVSTLAKNLYSSLCTRSSNIQLLLDIAPIELNPNLAIYCGLIINELLSNALKYAFPEGQFGTIGIRIHQESKQELVLKIWDTGIGLAPDFNLDTCHSLGLPLVYQLVTVQLQGTIERLPEVGTAFKIHLGTGLSNGLDSYGIPKHFYY